MSTGSSTDLLRGSNLKHELRTPLNHIIGYCEMLIEEAEDEEKKASLGELQRIHAGGRQLLGAVNRLFDREEAGEPHLTDAELQAQWRAPLNQIIGAAEMLEERATEAGRSVADLQKIHTAARTLLKLVSERLRSSSDGALPADALSVTTTFLRKENATTPGGQPLTGRILVVDDNELNRDMLSRRLERLGHTVSHAVNGRQALELIRRETYDLILLDVVMPEMNGYEVLDELKADAALRALPVIVLSASNQNEDVIQCIEMGADDYLLKPFDPVLLQARISACLEKKRLRDQEVSYLRQIQEEKQRSEDLLHVILPRDIATELKTTRVVRPRRFDNVGVLFCDIVGFTSFCERHAPEHIHTHLQSLVETFEQLTARHQLEKVKTIGDCFMATAGLLEPLENPALNCARCGLEMVQLAKAHPPFWQVRVGIHVGPVSAGVVGHRKYQYDIWGDTVNTAARLQNAADEGSVCVTAETWALLRDHCRGECQGRISIKGKGELELFRLA
jgi:class 3 adenylate cyclase/signal transduction histidine kinase